MKKKHHRVSGGQVLQKTCKTLVLGRTLVVSGGCRKSGDRKTNLKSVHRESWQGEQKRSSCEAKYSSARDVTGCG